VLANLHLVGQLTDPRPDSGPHSLDCQQELVLAMFEAGLFHRALAKVEKLPDLMAKRR
jgi:hypothetical protein